MRQSAQPRLVYLVAFVLLAACSHGAEYDYWQVTGTADGRPTGPEKLITVTRDQPPSEQDPIEVAPKPVEGAVKYTILRAPASKPATASFSRHTTAPCGDWFPRQRSEANETH